MAMRTRDLVGFFDWLLTPVLSLVHPSVVICRVLQQRRRSGDVEWGPSCSHGYRAAATGPILRVVVTAAELSTLEVCFLPHHHYSQETMNGIQSRRSQRHPIPSTPPTPT